MLEATKRTKILQHKREGCVSHKDHARHKSCRAGHES